MKRQLLVLLADARKRLREQDSGLFGVEERWSDLVTFSGKHGKRLRQRFDQASSATWYFITHDPHAFATWLGRESELRSIASKVSRSNISVVWVFHGEELYASQRPLLVVNAPEDGVTYSPGMHLLRNASTSNSNRWLVLSSQVPHFYLAFLSVPDVPRNSEDHAPAGTFGFVQPYLLAPRSYAARAGLYLEANGDSANQFLVDYYYKSIVDFVRIGQEQGWLTQTS
ncbi:hypothetical protein [Streptomyces sp. BPTC-684]|uniref:hypothetical protein n=1 Tax=Streptomyces sp. BPTC-684 TaxID=3043734 RepID=UPI0024B0E3A9|nr:hypothetical protein [Streptomyces sp. BPTC-684]WHM41125.1 hypothetical protein QIY60_32550 [Streptomyces sp. BPTC-684]